MYIDGIVSLFVSISLYLTQLIYPVIPKLYSLFEKLATFGFLTDDYIHSVWNNIYVLVGVIVLFAIAIKLISTIVNPDTLSDNKKGVKGLYFRTVIAVILIFIIPFIFSASFELEKKLMDSNFLISRVFGYKIAEGSDVGQLLAWTTFSSFCSPTDQASETSLNFWKETQHDISNIGNLLVHIRVNEPFIDSDNKTTFVSYNYHAILCPLTGFIIAYEILLLCMDTLFRVVKLSFLELMLPIILGAFVFNPEILKKWAKEFVSTYLSLFLKVLAIGFMIISFVSIRAYVEGDPFFEDWLMQGLLNALFLIALLQLVKKIPDLINSLFGTHIKTAGGIKGRLGEMAGIGAIASKAWTSLGTGAKNLGKMTLMAPVAGAAFGANAIYKANTGRNLTDTKGVRGIRAAGSAIGTAWKTGNVSKSIEAAGSTYNKTNTSPLDKAKRVSRINDDLDKILINGNGNSVVNEIPINDKITARNKVESRIGTLGGKKVAEANKNYQNKNLAASFAKSIDSDNKSISQLMNTAMGRYAVGSKEQTILSDALAKYDKDGLTSDKYENGKLVSEGLRTFIMNNQELFDSATLDNLVGANGKIISKERKIDHMVKNADEFKLTTNDIDNLGRGSAAISFLADNTLKGRAESAKTDLDIALAGAKLSEMDKTEVDRYISTMSDINNSMAFAVGRTDKENKLSRDASLSGATITTPTADSTSTVETPIPEIDNQIETVIKRVNELKAKNPKSLTVEEQAELMMKENIVNTYNKRKNNKDGNS